MTGRGSRTGAFTGIWIVGFLVSGSEAVVENENVVGWWIFRRSVASGWYCQLFLQLQDIPTSIICGPGFPRHLIISSSLNIHSPPFMHHGFHIPIPIHTHHGSSLILAIPHNPSCLFLDDGIRTGYG